jgi:hypothetical protein
MDWHSKYFGFSTYSRYRCVEITQGRRLGSQIRDSRPSDVRPQPLLIEIGPSSCTHTYRHHLKPRIRTPESHSGPGEATRVCVARQRARAEKFPAEYHVASYG